MMVSGTCAATEPNQPFPFPFSLLEMSRHRICPVEGFVASRAFSHSVDQSVLDARVAKDVTTALEDGVFKVRATN